MCHHVVQGRLLAFEGRNRVAPASGIEFIQLGRGVGERHVDVLEGAVEARSVGHRRRLAHLAHAIAREFTCTRGLDERYEQEQTAELRVVALLFGHPGDGSLERLADWLARNGRAQSLARADRAGEEMFESEVLVVAVAVHVPGLRCAGDFEQEREFGLLGVGSAHGRVTPDRASWTRSSTRGLSEGRPTLTASAP